MITVVIVNFESEESLITCLRSLQKEAQLDQVIVVDNSAADQTPAQETQLRQRLKRAHSKMKYLPLPRNIGYGAAINLAVQQTKSPYLYILNPDCQVRSGSTAKLLTYLEQHSATQIAAPVLIDAHGHRYPVGSFTLTPWRAIWSLSLLHRWWPANPVANTYFVPPTFTRPKTVDVVPGTAFMIRTAVFKKLGGFDPQFFLYFEESDLCYRLKQISTPSQPDPAKRGYWSAQLTDERIMLLPSAKVTHHGGTGVQNAATTSIFRASRFRYFAKHFGTLSALLVEFICQISTFQAILLGLASLTLTITMIYLLW